MGAIDSSHLLVVGAGPGLGASVARRFAREGYRLTLVARSQATAALADELRDARTDVAVAAADAGDPDNLRAAIAPMFDRAGAPGVVIYSAALAASDDLLSVTPDQLAAAYSVNVIGAVVTAQVAVPAMRAVCQCHGSRFDIGTGAVVNGPATEALNLYDVQETQGSIQIRA